MTKPLVPLLYLVYREALSSILASQVLTPLAEHQGLAKVTLGIITPIGQLLRSQLRPAFRSIEENCRRASLDIAWIPSPPSRTPWLWSNVFVLRQWISKRFQCDQPFIVRSRNATMTGIALDALRGFEQARVIFDCRGAEVTETIQLLGLADRPPSHWSPANCRAVEQARQMERRAVEQSAGVTCVSQAMVDVLRATYPNQPAEKFFVVPCCPDVVAFSGVAPQRDSVRLELGFVNKFIVSYVGSLAWYQLPEASFRVFRVIKTQRPDAHFFAITTEPDKMRQLATQAGILPEDITIRSVSAGEVPRLLVASDLGLMLRDDSETNRVASPIKFGEYMAAGIPVVISSQLGDYSAAVRTRGLGVEVDLAGDVSAMSHSLGEILRTDTSSDKAARQRCREYAAAELSWSSVTPRLAAWYESLLQSSHRSSRSASTNEEQT